MVLNAKVGRILGFPGADAPLRSAEYGQLVVVNDGAKHKEAVLGGKVFIGSNPLGSPVTTQAGLSEVTPALVLHNPAHSGVFLVLMKVNIVVTTAPAANTIFALAANTSEAAAPTSTTDATVRSALIGKQPGNAGKCYRVSTLAAAPTAFKYLGGILAAASTGKMEVDVDIDGEVIIPPGGTISLQTTTAVAILASFTWEEITVKQ